MHLCCSSFRCLKRGWSSQQVGADTRIGHADWSDWHIPLWFEKYKCITNSMKRRSLLQACFHILPCRKEGRKEDYICSSRLGLIRWSIDIVITPVHLAWQNNL